MRIRLRSEFDAVLAILSLFTAFLTMPGAVSAQTNLNTKPTAKGETIRTPYITYAEFQNISVNERATFSELLSVSSLDGVIQALGEPKTFDRNASPDGEMFTATLDYTGMVLDYIKRPGKEIRLETIELRSSDWFLKVGGKILRPGMKVDSLSSAIQNTITSDTILGEDDIDGIGTVLIAKPGKSDSGEVETMDATHGAVTLHINKETGTVKVVRFSRVV